MERLREKRAEVVKKNLLDSRTLPKCEVLCHTEHKCQPSHLSVSTWSVSVDMEEAMQREGQKCWRLKEKFKRKAKKHYKINPSYFCVLSGAVADFNPFLGKSVPISVLSGTLAVSGRAKWSVFRHLQLLQRTPPDCVAFSFERSIWYVKMNLGSFFFILNSADETLNSEKWACQYWFS